MILDSPSPSLSSISSHFEDEKEERRRLHHDAEVVIIGAGVVGCVLAVALSNQGRSVILLENSLKEPNRIVGELLQAGGVETLKRLGLGHCLEEIDAITVTGYDVIYHGEEVEIRYPKPPGAEDSARPTGKSFHHGRFVQKLREAAMRAENVTVVETTATELIKNGYTGQVLGVECKTKGEKDYYFGHLTVVCDGYASKFRKEYNRHSPVVRSKFYALELIDADLPLPNSGHVILGDGSPCLLYQIGTHETRALIDVPTDCPTASPAVGGIKNHLRTVVLPTLPESVKPSFEAAMEQQVRSMPNSWLPPVTNKTPGMIMVGDAMNMRHPLTGGGMTVGINDVALLTELLSPELCPRLDDTTTVLKQMKSFHWKRKDISSVINILAQALYSLFAANNANLKALQIGCFRYFQIGGNCVDGPVGLLAGIIRNPFVLFYHFFAVAFYAIWIQATMVNPIFAPFTLVFGGLSIIWTAICVIGPYIVSELKY
ncbi:hypothetical protein BLS_008738 [Venturia inaequalis]|nr:hypothetical protein BLS_008738 [Venturia inaequalis]